MAIDLPRIVSGTHELVFEIGAALSRACVLFKTGSDAGTGLVDLASDYASVEALCVRLWLIDARNVLVRGNRCPVV